MNLSNSTRHYSKVQEEFRSISRWRTEKEIKTAFGKIEEETP